MAEIGVMKKLTIGGSTYILPVPDTVSFTRLVNSGTKIGTITIGSSSTDIYAPVPATYESETAEEEGTTLSLVTTGEKYIWNQKTNNEGTVKSITITQGTGITVSNSGTAITESGSRTISLASNYGDAKNPYASKTKNYVLAAPSNADGTPGFRALVAADIPDLSDTYLTSFSETDPTVPNWAKQASKPTYTASEVGAIAASAKGAANGVVPLNESSKIDSTYLPSYVDDVLEYNGTTSFPSPGEAGKIYVDTSTNKTYRWGGTTYTEISQGSIVTVSRSLTSGTKSATITVDGTAYDIYAVTNTDEKIKLTSQSTSGSYPLIFGPTSISSDSTYQGYYNTNITVNPNTKTITANTFVGALTGTASGNLTSSSTLDATKLSGAVPAASLTNVKVSSNGSGNVITGLSATNGTITYTMGTITTTAAQIIRWDN